MATYDRTTEDAGNVVSLDHLNLTIADQPSAIAFYIMGLGLTRDPYMTVGLDNMWLNAGRHHRLQHRFGPPNVSGASGRPLAT